MLINGFDAWAVVGGQKVDLSSQQYGGDVLHPDGSKRIVQFEDDPWPTWTYRLPGGIELTQEIFVPHGSSAVVINFRCADRSVPIKIYLRPFLSVRDFHALHHENSTFKFDHYEAPGCVKWRPYKGLPQIVTRTSAHYTHDPQWYRNFSYAQEKARGLDSNEDLVSPGVFEWAMARGEAGLIFYAEGFEGDMDVEEPFHNLLRTVKRTELDRRKNFPTRLHKAADAFVVKRGERKTIIAGYPWFNDWGRDTFISLRGLCLATGRLDDARLILLEWMAVRPSERTRPTCTWVTAVSVPTPRGPSNCAAPP
jgi:predicted glycogen debranching enzyme